MPQNKSGVKVKKVSAVKAQPSRKVLQKPFKESFKSMTKPKSAKTGLSAMVFDITGKQTGSFVLPKEIFGQSPNETLLAQAFRIYFANSTAHFANTKTRSQTRGGGKKPWKQKGTGNARAGSRRSPLWVGGGISLGPKPRKSNLELPKKMKRKALFTALSKKAKEGNVKIISNLESIKPKTKIVANLLQKIETQGETLFVVTKNAQSVKLASRNLKNVSIDEVRNLNVYSVLRNKALLFSKEAMGEIS